MIAFPFRFANSDFTPIPTFPRQGGRSFNPSLTLPQREGDFAYPCQPIKGEGTNCLMPIHVRDTTKGIELRRTENARACA